MASALITEFPLGWKQNRGYVILWRDKEWRNGNSSPSRRLAERDDPYGFGVMYLMTTELLVLK